MKHFEVTPRVGGALAARLGRWREDVLDRRHAALGERSKQPSIAEFYAGRNVFLTGGSGFLGRLIVEMLLRTCPDIGNLYLLVRTKKGVTPQERLRSLLDIPLFDRVRAERPGVLDKIVVLPGDITSLGLGLSEEHSELLQREVSVIFNVAASVRFDDPFQKAVFTNLRSTRELVVLARGMPQLRALVHVSTAYTNINQEPVGEVVYPPHQDWKDVIRWAEELGEEKQNAIDLLGHKLLGFQPNMYTFTKALAEQLIDDVADELPVIITRPSIIMNTLQDPFPGWIDNLYGLGGFWAGGMKGLIRVVYDPRSDTSFDTIPADTATKTIILASWHRGCRSGTRLGDAAAPGGSDVVNVAVGLGNGGLSNSDMTWASTKAGVQEVIPYPGAVRCSTIHHIRNKAWFEVLAVYHHLLFGFMVDLLARAAGVKPRVLDLYRKMEAGLQIAGIFRNNFDFTVENQNTLQVLMHPDDEKQYSILAWSKTRDTIEDFRELCASRARGILVYVLKEEDNPKKNLIQYRRLEWAVLVYHSLMALIFFFISYTFLEFFFRHRYQINV